MARSQKYFGLSKDACDTSKPSPDASEKGPIFICIDVEAYESDASKITEVGVSSLDTQNITGIAPGDYGVNWRAKARSRHFIVAEHVKLVNKRYVKGCPDKFQFGVSETMPKMEVNEAILACFAVAATSEPAATSGATTNTESTSKYRNIVLVGHALNNDVQYMRALGISSKIMSTVIDTFDTQTLASSKKQPRSLKKVLNALQIEPHHLHNAGNDAAYTLQAFVAMQVLTQEQRLALVLAMETRPPTEEEKNKRTRKKERRAAKLQRRMAWLAGKKGEGGKKSSAVVNGLDEDRVTETTTSEGRPTTDVRTLTP